MQFRLLVDLEVIDFLQTVSKEKRRRLLNHFRKIQNFPGHFSDYIASDEIGRRLDVSVFDGLAIFYWTDAADQHIKILKIASAE